jgi:uncharacterized RmlC-like cupin family protein/ketosteroid isomerase-like protein
MVRDNRTVDWRLNGVRVVRAGELDPNTPQTPGMHREAAIDAARAGAEKLWAGTVVIHPDAKTGPHHHGELESVIYVVSGRARMRWGERLEYTAEAGPGDFIYVPPFVPHQEINASADSELSCVVVRSGQEPVVVNLDMPAVEENPQEIHWVDDIHKALEPRTELDVLRALYDDHNAAGAGFPDLLARDYLHEDVEFVEFAAAPGPRTYRGSEAVAELFRNRFEAGAMHVDDVQLTALDGHRVLAAFRVSIRGVRSGAESSMQLWNLVTLAGSRITRVEEFSDEADARAAAG